MKAPLWRDKLVRISLAAAAFLALVTPLTLALANPHSLAATSDQ
jgi:hypothetical protein